MKNLSAAMLNLSDAPLEQLVENGVYIRCYEMARKTYKSDLMVAIHENAQALLETGAIDKNYAGI